ncbi:hypothetical protein [Coraliomargarita parva]|uniref:hypothetical protein n=1 Tax=Coraliomargarita parva TaxID=3014050 RepID=UPI0022B4808B|nr:hypothetical protein [Coraliomargarita parva]
MKPKKVLFWIIFLVIAYNLFNYAKMHTRGEVVAYKRFAKAVMKGDDYTARQLTVDHKLALEVFSRNKQRAELFGNASIVFTYYRIKEWRPGEDGKSVYLVADQISRVNPEGFDTIWGEQKVVIRQTVQMTLVKDAWLVAVFNDPAMGP